MIRNRKEKSLYPSTLIHFTKKYDTLIKILECSYFKASHSTEEIHGTSSVKSRKFAIPMVSFCDIRLANLMEHTKKYGAFGIGLRKTWGIENGLNPVFYVNSECSMIDYLNEALRSFKDDNLSDCTDLKYHAQKEQYKNFINPLRYMKNYEGILERKGKETVQNYRFANENEWRYVPDIRSEVVPIRLSKNKELGDERLGNHMEAKLMFSHDDIRYIFVKSNFHLNKLINDINEIFSDEDVKNQMLSKIFVTSNIFYDL